MEYFYIYLLQLSSVIEGFSILVAIASIIMFIITVMQYLVEKDFDKEFEETKRVAKTFCVVLAITAFLCLFPTKQTLILLGATHLGKKAISSTIVNEKIEKVNKIIDLELDKKIKELNEND